MSRNVTTILKTAANKVKQETVPTTSQQMPKKQNKASGNYVIFCIFLRSFILERTTAANKNLARKNPINQNHALRNLLKKQHFQKFERDNHRALFAFLRFFLLRQMFQKKVKNVLGFLMINFRDRRGKRPPGLKPLSSSRTRYSQPSKKRKTLS